MINLSKIMSYVLCRTSSTILPSKYINFSDIHNMESKCRIVNPPSQLIPEGEYKDVVKGFGSRKTTVRVMKTPHGFYVKPKEKLFEVSYESTFHFGMGCHGFDPERVVYYPLRDCY